MAKLLPDLKRLVMRHHRRFAPALELAARVRDQLVVPFEAFDRQNLEVERAIQEELATVLSTRDTFGLWSYARRFEYDFAAWCGRTQGIGTSSCTAALEMTLVALGIGPGDEVLTSAHTFIATALAIRNTGALPVLVDPRHSDLCVDVERLERHITPRTRAIVPVHMHGQVCEMGPILEMAEQRGLFVVEDCAQAHGARLHGCRVPIGPIGCFSFWPSKPLGAAGNGGILVTDDAVLAEKVNRMRDPDAGDPIVLRGGRTPGFLNPLEIALLRARLPQLERWRLRRAEIAASYQKALGHLDPLREAPGAESAWASFPIRVPDRDALRRRLLLAGIETRVEYPVPFFRSPSMTSMGWVERRWPEAEDAALRGCSLPTHPQLTHDETRRIIQATLAACPRESAAP